jgi:hypothetical protein
MFKQLVIVCLLVTLSFADESEPTAEVAIDQPQRNWFYRAFDSIEDTFKGECHHQAMLSYAMIRRVFAQNS